MTEGQLKELVRKHKDPETGRPISEKQIGDITMEDGSVRFQLGLTTFAAPLWNEIRDSIAADIKAAFPGAGDVAIELTPHYRAAKPLGETNVTIKNVVAVGSGKGGVGKSTVAAAIALGLHKAGCKVGLLDADFYGPSIPKLLGINEKPAVLEDRILPVDVDGMPVMSVGFLVAEKDAVIWRGPMLHKGLTEFLQNTEWGELDHLIIDMPPGTGDVAMSLSQLLPISGSVVVCTPQQVALLDAVKAIDLFRKVEIDCLGLVENMSSFICPDCGSKHDIFKSGGVRATAEAENLAFLGDLPINPEICTVGDTGRLATCWDEGPLAESLGQIRDNLMREIVKRREQSPPSASLPIV